MNVNVIRVEFNVTAGAYSNDKNAHTNYRRACRQDIRYQRSADHLPVDHRTEHYESNDISSIRTDDCTIFAERRSPSDCVCDSDNASMKCLY